MDYNYHTHTYLCRHADGMPEEYVLRAIENGIKYMGFSDHVPLIFDDGSESSYRILTADAEKYICEIRRLAEKYKDKIDLKIGFEVEYYPEYFERTLKYAKELGAEYFILGQHYIVPENISNHRVVDSKDKAEFPEKYVSTVIEAMKTGKFTYVAHPDIFGYSPEDEIYEREAERLCRASVEYDVPLEINFLGIRRKRIYPHEFFWEIAGRVCAPVTFGFDAHATEDAYDGESLEKALALVKKFSLNYVGRPKIRSI